MGNEMVKQGFLSFVRRHFRLVLVTLFALVIFIPGSVLGFLAFRALEREEAFLEKTLSVSMSAEVSNSASLIQQELTAIEDELDKALAFPETFKPFPLQSARRDDQSLVDLIFAVSSRGEVLWPDASKNLTANEKTFLAANAAVLKGNVSVPIVKNVAYEYRELANTTQFATDREKERAASAPSVQTQTTQTEAIPETSEKREDSFGYFRKDIQPSVAESQTREKDFSQSRPDDVSRAQDLDIASAGLIEEKTSGATDAVSGAAADQRSVTTSPSSTVKKAMVPQSQDESSVSMGRSLYTEEKTKQEALNAFELNPSVRERVYEQAEEEGAQILQRTVTVGQNKPAEVTEERSVHILASGTFAEITAGKKRGLFARIDGDRFTVLFWKKSSEGNIIGCVVNMDAIRSRIIKILPVPRTDTRLLLVLDENALPLSPMQDTDPDLRFPFVAKEISETLPRWEAAAYFLDPGFIEERAQATTSTLWIIISCLLLFLLAGGIIIIVFLMGEIRMAEQKTSFVANVSHELKTPLTSIRLFAEMLATGVRVAREKQNEYLGLMLSETERLSRLIANVLDFQAMSGNRKRYQMQNADLVTTVRDVVEAERLRLEKESFFVSFSSRVKKLTCTFCPESITRVIINLISNAEKYAETGKAIDVSVSREAKAAVVTVADRGPGIPSWATKKIFKAFYRIDDSINTKTQGSGLGLAIVNRIVRDHNGSIRVLEREGGGSIFQFSIPLSTNRLNSGKR